MKNLTKYIKESIFDVENNIDKVGDVVACKKWVDTFATTNDFKSSISEFISDLEKAGTKFTKKPIPNTYMVYYKKINDNSLYNWYIKFIIPNNKTSWKSAMIGRTGRMLGRKIHYIYSDTTTFDKSIIERDIKKEGAYVLPEKYYKIIDIIQERSEYIKESILDIDNNISNVDDPVLAYKWINEFQNTNNIRKTFSKFLKEVIKQGGYKEKLDNLNGDEIFCRYIINDKGSIYEWLIDFYLPTTHNAWYQGLIFKMSSESTIACDKTDYTIDKKRLINAFLSNDIIILPKKYIKLIELIREKSK